MSAPALPPRDAKPEARESWRAWLLFLALVGGIVGFGALATVNATAGWMMATLIRLWDWLTVIGFVAWVTGAIWDGFSGDEE